MRNISIVVAACTSLATQAWAATATATVQSGQKTQIAIHTRFDSQCQPARVEIKLLKVPANGTVSWEPKDSVVPAQNKAGVKQPAQCVGKGIVGVVVFYQSKTGFVRTDDFRFSHVNANKADDRFNAEVGFTVTVK